jgi:hypothetical protein
VGHVLTPDDSAILGPALAAAIPTVVGAASAVVAALRARLKVTPLSDPRNAAGQALTARPPIPQRPGVADHAAPEEAPTEAMRQAHLNEPVDYPESPPGR